MLWAALVVGAFLGGFIQPITGFGAAPILVLFMAPFFPMTVAPSIVAAVCAGLSLPMTWRFRRDIDWRGVALPVSVYTVVSLLVIRVLGSLDLHLLTAAFGAFLVLLSIYFLFFSKRASVRPTRTVAVVCSAFSGVCAGLFSVGGPMMALYFVAANEKRETYLGNLQFLFLVTNAVSVVARSMNGLYDLSYLPLTALGIAVMNLGERIGSRAVKRINTANVKTVVYIGVGVSGLLTLLEQL